MELELSRFEVAVFPKNPVVFIAAVQQVFTLFLSWLERMLQNLSGDVKVHLY